MARITVVAVFLSFIELSYYLFLISWQCASGLRSFLPISLMNVSAKPISTYCLSSGVGGSVLFHRFNVGDYDLLLLFPFFLKVFLHRNWLVLLFRSYLLSTSLASKPLGKVLFFASKHFLIFCHHHFTLQS